MGAQIPRCGTHTGTTVSERQGLTWVVLAVAATVLGIWLGLSGADVSPIFTQAPFRAGGPPR
jgi:hypothetical protein